MTVDQPLSYILLQTSTTQRPTEKKERNKKRLLKKKKKTHRLYQQWQILAYFWKGLRETLLQQNIHSISRWLSIVQAKAGLDWSTFLNKLPLDQSVCLAVIRSTSVKDDQFSVRRSFSLSHALLPKKTRRKNDVYLKGAVSRQYITFV